MPGTNADMVATMMREAVENRGTITDDGLRNWGVSILERNGWNDLANTFRNRRNGLDLPADQGMLKIARAMDDLARGEIT